jgi:hypothetical protein
MTTRRATPARAASARPATSRRHGAIARVVVLVAALVLACAASGAVAPLAAAGFAPGQIWGFSILDGASHADDQYIDVARAADGSLYAMGMHDFDYGVLPGHILMVKFTAAGTMAWQRSCVIPGAQQVDPRAVAVDREGNVIAVATFWDGADRDWFVVKWDAAGNVQWTADKGSADPTLNDEAADVVTDKTGDVYVCGTMGSGAEAVVVKYNDEADPANPATGLEEWSRYTTGNHATESAEGTSIAIDGNGDLYTTGSRLMKTGDDNVFVQKIRGGTGGLLWMRGWDGAAHRPDGGVVVRYRGGGVFVGGATETKSHSNDIVVLRYSARTGARGWVRTWDNAATHDSDEFSDLRVDGYGNVYVTGTTFTMTAVKYKALLLKIGRTGTVKWKRTYYDKASNGFGSWWSLAVDTAGNAWTVGFVRDATTALATVARYDKTGKRVWLTRWDGTPVTTVGAHAQACVLSGTLDLFVAGSTMVTNEFDDAAVIWLRR